jgi:hypothetical protein
MKDWKLPHVAPGVAAKVISVLRFELKTLLNIIININLLLYLHNLWDSSVSVRADTL